MTYHHGNLRVALLEAASDMVAESGPDALTLRAVARQVAEEAPRLLSPAADQAASAAFANLASTILSNNARTLEDLVQEMLRPMLKSWLDENLPVLVEKLVRQEIERVARGGRR